MDLWKRRNGIFSETEVQMYAWQIVEACHYLHSHNIIHRDLKLANIFLDENNNVKLGDFGLAARLTDPNERKRTLCGTPNYLAPEILKSNQTNNGHSFQVDIWSIGVIIYTLLFRKPPFETSSLKDTYRLINSCTFRFPDFQDTPAVSPAAKDLLTLIFRDESLRPSWEQIRKHPFFTQSPIPTALPNLSRSQPFPFKHFSLLSYAEQTMVLQNIPFQRLQWTPFPFFEEAPQPNAANNVPPPGKEQKPEQPQQQQPQQQKIQVPIQPQPLQLTTSQQQTQLPTGFASNTDKTALNRPRPLAGVELSRQTSTQLNLPTQTTTNPIRTQSSSRFNQQQSFQPNLPTAAPLTTKHALSAPQHTGLSRSNTHQPQQQLLQSHPQQRSNQIVSALAPQHSTPHTMSDHAPSSQAFAAGLSTPNREHDGSIPQQLLNQDENYTDVWVNLWVDYSTRYGLGYILSNGSCGVCFNDASAMILHADNVNGQYITPNQNNPGQYSILHYVLDNHPPELNKKAQLLKHFLNFLITYDKRATMGDEAQNQEELTTLYPGCEDYLEKTTPFDLQTATTVPLPHVKSFRVQQENEVIALRLSNRTTQLLFTADHSELIVDSFRNVMIFTDKTRQRWLTSITNWKTNVTNPDFYSRIKYVTDNLPRVLALPSNSQSSSPQQTEDLPQLPQPQVQFSHYNHRAIVGVGNGQYNF